MKIYNKLAVAITAMSLFATTIAGATALKGDITINGDVLECDVAPQIINDRTMVPMRAIFEALGCEVNWDGENQFVVAIKENNVIALQIGTNSMMANNELVELDSPPVIFSDRTLVPIRAISEALSMDVKWDGATENIFINDKNSQNIAEDNTETENNSQADTPQADNSQNDSGMENIPNSDNTAEIPENQLNSNEIQTMINEVLSMVNDERAKVGAEPLALSEELSNVAYLHSKDMADNDFFSHTNLQGQSPFDRLKANKISYQAAAENIAAGQRTAAAAMDSWMNSEGHKENILNPSLKKIGIGIAYGGSYGIYWTQVFAG